ncbi:microtubule-associated protein 1B-like [Impatiens glandulifera]|uniref:microtubule-associated protein 1B-like n=1 Tax=Impatiens glandulifera TaxID=253017 RepID=UPI001FB11316|nr:microtubule-associated protein 1B-like [Impatiens glandulifera]
MASPVPAKSQTALSFSLPQWKLTKNHSSSHRRSADSSPHQQLPPHESSPGQSSVRKESPMRDSSSESESSHEPAAKRKKTSPQAESGKNGSFGSSSSDQAMIKEDKPAEVSDHDKDESKESKTKTQFRLKRASSKKNKPCEAQEEWKAPNAAEGAEVDESLAKTWNLRPRRHTQRQSDTDEGNPSMAMAETKLQPSQSLPKGSEIRSAPLLEAAKKQRTKFSITLARDEIEEDIFAMTGLKPSRRVKKRSRSIQKQLDNVFPGLWLSSTVTPDAYKVSRMHKKD